MYKTEQKIRIMKDGKVLETFTIIRDIEHTGAAIGMYKLVVDEDYYDKLDYDIITVNEDIDKPISNALHRQKQLEKIPGYNGW